jgi:hypothetical protein
MSTTAHVVESSVSALQWRHRASSRRRHTLLSIIREVGPPAWCAWLRPEHVCSRACAHCGARQPRPAGRAGARLSAGPGRCSASAAATTPAAGGRACAAARARAPRGARRRGAADEALRRAGTGVRPQRPASGRSRTVTAPALASHSRPSRATAASSAGRTTARPLALCRPCPVMNTSRIVPARPAARTRVDAPLHARARGARPGRVRWPAAPARTR